MFRISLDILHLSTKCSSRARPSGSAMSMTMSSDCVTFGSCAAKALISSKISRIKDEDQLTRRGVIARKRRDICWLRAKQPLDFRLSALMPCRLVEAVCLDCNTASFATHKQWLQLILALPTSIDCL